MTMVNALLIEFERKQINSIIRKLVMHQKMKTIRLRIE